MVLPLVGMISGKDFSNMYIGLNEARQAAAASGTVSLVEAQKLGPVFAMAILSAVVNFLLIAFVVFIVLKGINKMKKAKEESAPAGSILNRCFTDGNQRCFEKIIPTTHHSCFNCMKLY